MASVRIVFTSFLISFSLLSSFLCFFTIITDFSKKVCAEARLLQQPSTTAPSAIIFFVIGDSIGISYYKRKAGRSIGYSGRLVLSHHKTTELAFFKACGFLLLVFWLLTWFLIQFFVFFIQLYINDWWMAFACFLPVDFIAS